jgi:virulence factor
MLRLGIIGLDDIEQKAYLPVFSSMNDLELHLFTRNEEKLEEISQRYRFSNIYPSLKLLIKIPFYPYLTRPTLLTHEICKKIVRELEKI